MRRHPGRTPVPPTVGVLGLLLLVSLVGGVGLRAAGIGWGEVLRFLWAGATGGTVHAEDAAPYTIVREIRLPRVLLGAVVLLDHADLVESPRDPSAVERLGARLRTVAGQDAENRADGEGN
ncbi:hypothetical protein BKI49_29255 [Streptomyces sp. Tue6028]|uniref:hypothetical protein n=1 Tax=Streptomyces sp. Tue6028 TaxID=2036037 RepID=UPI000BC41D2E|nr:hypothetical protein BKI49_29255 [Streptomyces sp. Tue6028]